MIWTHKSLNRAAELKSVYSYPTTAEIMSEELGETVTPEQLRSALRRYNRRSTPQHTISSVMEYPKESAPVPEMPGFDSPLSMESSGALVIADLHTPYHSKEMLELAMLVSSDPKYGVSDVIIAGDLFDLSSASSHPANEYRSQISSDIESAGNVIKYISSFPHINRVTVLNGNHDERLAKRSGTNLSLRHLVNAAIGDKYVQADVVVTEYDYVEYNDSWLIGHLSTYSRRPGEVARRIAELYKKNVAVGHDHIQGYTSTLDGKYIAISMGAMFSNNSGSTPFWYKERRLTDMPRMSLGFLILSGSVPFLFNEYGMSSLNGGASWQDIGIDVLCVYVDFGTYIWYNRTLQTELSTLLGSSSTGDTMSNNGYNCSVGIVECGSYVTTVDNSARVGLVDRCSVKATQVLGGSRDFSYGYHVVWGDGGDGMYKRDDLVSIGDSDLLTSHMGILNMDDSSSLLMDLRSVSTSIEQLVYRYSERQLTVWFASGGVYLYYGIGRELIDQIRRVVDLRESVGSFLHQSVFSAGYSYIKLV